jgi:hypothetical protein
VRATQLDLPLAKGSPREASVEREAERPRAQSSRLPAGAEHSPFELPVPAPQPQPQSRQLPPKPVLVEQARRVADALASSLGRPVRLYVTDNASTMVSFRRMQELLTVRLHHMFLDAPDEVVRAVADYVGRGRRGAGEVIDRYVRANTERIRVSDPRRVSARLDPRGAVWDLREIFDQQNARYFGNTIQAAIGWGRGTFGRRRRSIRMGVYDHLTRTIRIHPALDRSEVPRFFVEYIVFHEMLHQAVPGRQTGSRRQHHGPEFRARERAYPDYERAIAWERENLGLLLGRDVARRPGGDRLR